MPAATTAGQIIHIIDESGNCSHTNIIRLVSGGTDSIEGEATYALDYNHASIKVESNGAGVWVIVTNPGQHLSAGARVQPSLTDLGTGSITIGTGIYAVYSNTDGIGRILTHTLAGGTFALTDGVVNYVVADHSSGSPVVRVTTTVSEIQETTIIPIYTIYREGTVLHIFNWDQLGDALANKMHKSIVKTQRFRLESGLAIGEAATRTVTLTAGTVWTGAVGTTMPAIRSDTGSMYLMYHVAGVWTKSAPIAQYNNTQYDDGTALQTLPGGKYAVNFVYRSVGQDNELFLLLGAGAYSLGQAQASQPPALPPIISSHCILVGRIIVNQGGSTATQIDSSFVTQFTPTAASDHNTLANLQGGAASEYYHLTSLEYTGVGTGVHVRVNAPSVTGTWSFSGQINSGNTTASTSTATGAIVTPGGIGCGDFFTGKYRSSDGTAGLSATKTFYAASSSGAIANILNTVTIKDGIITSWTQV
jgi:hypothetical protein